VPGGVSAGAASTQARAGVSLAGDYAEALRMSGEVWFAKVTGRSGKAGLIPTDADSGKVVDGMADGECRAFEPVAIRDQVSFRRFWHLMQVTGKHVQTIEIDRVGGHPVLMRIWDEDSACEAIKFCCGHYDTMPVGSTDYAIRKARSISFRKMKQDEWAKFLPPVYDALLEKVAPQITDDKVRDDFLKCIEQGQARAEAEAA
jgi:hypothetical protein